MAIVSITKCASYDADLLKSALAEALSPLPIPDVRGKTVLLKPNLLSSSDTPDKAVNTHPEFVRAVAQFFLDRGVARLIIGDSCGNLAPGSTNRAIQLTCLDSVAADLKCDLLNMDRTDWEEIDIPSGRILKRIRLPKILNEVDLFVTLPKMKTHGLTTITGAVKNQLGLIPGRGKKDVHIAGPSPEAMANALLDIYTVARPHLAIMDGILAMEGNGPAAGKPRETGLILASDDCLSLDAVFAAVVGLKPEQIDMVRIGVERDLGAGKLKDISLKGVPLQEAAIRNFAMPPLMVRRAIFSLIPDFLWRWAFNSAGAAYAVVMDDRCVRCGECIANCPAHAFKNRDGKVSADPSKCIACYCCAEVCNARAIRFQRPLAGRLIEAMRNLKGRKQTP